MNQGASNDIITEQAETNKKCISTRKHTPWNSDKPYSTCQKCKLFQKATRQMHGREMHQDFCKQKHLWLQKSLNSLFKNGRTEQEKCTIKLYSLAQFSQSLSNQLPLPTVKDCSANRPFVCSSLLKPNQYFYAARKTQQVSCSCI